MRKVVILAFVALGVLGVGAVATAHDSDGSSHNGARLNGYQEVTSISTTGFGSFHIKFNRDDTADYVLSYRGIETPVTQAHIHFAQRAANGPIQVWLCEAAENGEPELRRPGAVDHAVVERERHVADGPHDDLSVPDDRAVSDPAEAEDRDLRMVHDRRLEQPGELPRARDREGRAAQLLR